MNKYVLLVRIGDVMAGVGPFVDFEAAAQYADKRFHKDEVLALSLRKPAEIVWNRPIGEVSDLLQALAGASARLYEEAPELSFSSMKEALIFIANSIDEPLVREHMLAQMKGD